MDKMIRGGIYIDLKSMIYKRLETVRICDGKSRAIQ